MISPVLGIETLATLIISMYKTKQSILSAMSSTLFKNNLYLFPFLSKVSEISSSNNACLIYSTNPKIECALLNTKLRIRIQNSLLNVFSMAGYYNSDIHVRFSNLSLVKSFSVFEGTYKILSKIYANSSKPSLITSNFFAKRGINLLRLFCFLRSTFRTIKIIKISEQINGEAIDYFNLKTPSTKYFSKKRKQVLIGVEDTFSLRKLFYYQVKKFDVYFGTHFNGLVFHSKIVLPALTHFEDERIVFNMEQKVLKTQKAYSTFFEARSCKNVLNFIYKSRKFYIGHLRRSHALSHVYAIVNSLNILDKTPFFVNLGLQFNDINKTAKLLMYPTKPALTNFYSSCIQTKNSLNMRTAYTFLQGRRFIDSF